ncbi:MAG TPA: NEW3 domain-containing protein [Gemmatimonadales bacterium]|nr:NEW3 domain-containing protein [Gemmatimonadales bacterium]
MIEAPAATPAPRTVATRAPATPRREVPITVRERAPAVRRAVTPRSVQLVRVPVPGQLPERKAVDWSVRPHPRAEVLSATNGTVSASAQDSARAITVVTRVPARANAGVLPVGEAEFRVDSAVVTVPIELVVERIRRMSVVANRPVVGAVAGQKVRIPLEVRNVGNSPDTAVVVADLPAGWTRAPEQHVALNPGERRVITFESRLPRGSGTTALYPTFRVLVGDSVASTATVSTQVEDREDGPRAVGPVLTVGTSTAMGDTAASSPALDFYVNGQISRRVSVLGRADYAVDEARLDRRALGRVGTYLGGAFLSVRGPGWYATAGNTGSTVSTIAGISAYGKGLSGAMNIGDATVSALVVGTEASSVQAGARGDYRIGNASVGLAASHLDEGTALGRRLDAVAFVGSALPWPKVKLTGEVGYRSFDGGSGAGAAFSAERVTPTSMLGANIQHAPGGSHAYGRALTDWSAFVGRRFNDRFSLQGNLFSSLDRPPSGSGEYTSDGWSVLPRYAITKDLIAEVTLRRNAYASESPTAGGFESRDRSTAIQLRKVNGRLGWQVGTSLNSVSRTTTFGSGTDVTINSQNFTVNGGASALTPRGFFGAGVEYGRSGAGAGLAARQGRFSLYASRIALFNSPSAPLFRAEAEYTTWFGDQKGVLISRVGAEAALPADFSIIVDAERNPLFQGSRSSTPWIVAVRLERGFTLGWAARHAMTRGAVFEDRNGNGVRDSDEPGLAGVMVRRGTESAVTDNEGRFAFIGTDRLPTEVDPTSLPQGVVAPVVRPTEGNQSLVLGVVPTGAIEVRLVPQADELGRRPESALKSIGVIARDSHGAEWYLRADTLGVVRFDALPPDRYTFSADFAGTTERLRQLGDPVILDVRPGTNLPPLEIKFSIRAARLFNGGAGSTDQGRQRRR